MVSSVVNNAPGRLCLSVRLTRVELARDSQELSKFTFFKINLREGPDQWDGSVDKGSAVKQDRSEFKPGVLRNGKTEGTLTNTPLFHGWSHTDTQNK